VIHGRCHSTDQMIGSDSPVLLAWELHNRQLACINPAPHRRRADTKRHGGGGDIEAKGRVHVQSLSAQARSGTGCNRVSAETPSAVAKRSAWSEVGMPRPFSIREMKCDETRVVMDRSFCVSLFWRRATSRINKGGPFYGENEI
jgi:hypothetical protein